MIFYTNLSLINILSHVGNIHFRASHIFCECNAAAYQIVNLALSDGCWMSTHESIGNLVDRDMFCRAYFRVSHTHQNGGEML